MVRDNRIKEVYFTPTYLGSGVTGSFPSVTGSREVHNGEILEVDWRYDGTGSIALSFGVTQEEFFRRNAPSGVGIQVSRPGVFTQHSTTGSIANAFMTNYVTNDCLWLTVGSPVSGTLPLLVHVRYR